jgi:hypothetical protein
MCMHMDPQSTCQSTGSNLTVDPEVTGQGGQDLAPSCHLWGLLCHQQDGARTTAAGVTCLWKNWCFCVLPTAVSDPTTLIWHHKCAHLRGILWQDTPANMLCSVHGLVLQQGCPLPPWWRLLGCNPPVVLWILNVPQSPVGHQPVVLLGGGGTFKRWGLVEESYIIGGVALGGIWTLASPLLSLLSSHLRWQLHFTMSCLP